MFYISRNIETEVFFTHHDMDKVASDEEILRRLRDKVEGYCHAEYGYVIQVIASSSDAKFFIDRVDIRKNGLFVRLKFSCIVFRRTLMFTQRRKTRSWLWWCQRYHKEA